ncbi:hypothetical protein [Azotobacter chroococcum]|uniref:hypothetical protein n=1 Tax=Azotobacter chroococcum TaxID=353 RepID=UPI001185A095|nr:hypothetical protein [Azotobacter chroococcum]
MNLNPLFIYMKAVDAVPSIKYALGVAGVIEAAMIAYNLTNEDPKKAILGFIFVLVGMYLLLIFASIGKVDDIIRGPVIIVVWALTVLFISCLVLTLSAHTVGMPCGWARLVGAVCADLRNTSAEGAARLTANLESKLSAKQSTQHHTNHPTSVEAVMPFQEQPLVTETFRILDSSNDCGINQIRTIEYCLIASAKVVDWSGPNIESANCGSSISNVRRVAGRENCIAVDVSVRGCGYDNIFGIQNCRGRGWIGGDIVINGKNLSR